MHAASRTHSSFSVPLISYYARRVLPPSHAPKLNPESRRMPWTPSAACCLLPVAVWAGVWAGPPAEVRFPSAVAASRCSLTEPTVLPLFFPCPSLVFLLCLESDVCIRSLISGIWHLTVTNSY